MAIGHSRKALGLSALIAGETSMGKWITVGMLDGFGGSRAAGEIALAAGVAPRPLRIPMPRLHRKFRILAICHRLPPCGEHSRQRRLTEVLLHSGCRHAIDPGAERLGGNERIGRMIRSRVYPNGLRIGS